MKRASSSSPLAVQPLRGKGREQEEDGEGTTFLIEGEEDESDRERGQEDGECGGGRSHHRPVALHAPAPTALTMRSPRLVSVSSAIPALPSPRPHGITSSSSSSTPRTAAESRVGAGAAEESPSTTPAAAGAHGEVGSSVKPWIPAVPSSAEEENEEEQAPSSPSKLKPKPPSGRVMGKGAYQSLANPSGANMNIIANVAFQRKTQEVIKLRAWSTEGPAWSRFLGFLGGAFLLFHHAYSFGHTAHRRGVHASMSVGDGLGALLFHALAALSGIAVLLLEGRACLCPVSLKKRSREYVKLLSYLWGRGCFYLLIAAILAVRLSDDASGGSTTAPPTVNAAAAGAFALLGTVDVCFGLMAQRRLIRLKGHLMEDEELIRAKFDRLDVDRRGRVSAADLAVLCAELGSRLSHQELEGAILTLDCNRNGEVEYEPFLEWWRTR